MMNFDGDGIEEYNELVAALDKHEYQSKPKKYELDMKNCESPPTRPSIEEAPKLELKALPPHLSKNGLMLDPRLAMSTAKKRDVAGRPVAEDSRPRHPAIIGCTRPSGPSYPLSSASTLASDSPTTFASVVEWCSNVAIRSFRLQLAKGTTDAPNRAWTDERAHASRR
ncbi:hypothetical protein H5410_052000 [Solanum commersonii]|uniref:Uncharacterized protein n=1 Tax=Solanum commersonii TaxID=4109 RepID=A0A9J5X1R6_SOLCO|nr:hypothetical protein H5410_052000 [Solanum commersonii]